MSDLSAQNLLPVTAPTPSRDDVAAFFDAVFNENKEEALAYLRQYGPYLAPLKKDASGRTALMMAVGSRDPDFRREVATLLLQSGADPDARTGFGSVLDYAEWYPDMTTLLVQHGVNVAGDIDNRHLSYLSRLAMQGKMEPMRAVLESGVAINVNEQDYEGTAALMTAAAQGHLNIVQYLIEKGADIDLRDDAGRTARDHAMSNDCFTVAEFLQQYVEDRAEALRLAQEAIAAAERAETLRVAHVQLSRVRGVARKVRLKMRTP